MKENDDLSDQPKKKRSSYEEVTTMKYRMTVTVIVTMIMTADQPSQHALADSSSLLP